MKPARKSRAAFTLVEIMLAIAILSIVIAAIYATWTAILRASRACQTVAAEVQRSRIAMDCVEQSLTYLTMFAANARYYSFVAENGSSATLSFVANLPKSFPRSGRFEDMPVRRVAFAVESSPEGGRQLVLRQAPLLVDFDEDEINHPLVLMQNVKRMEMAFWDAQQKDWVDEWIQTNQAPRLVRVVITTDNPKQPFDRGEEYIRIVSPAATIVSAGLQSGNPPGAPPGGLPPRNPPGPNLAPPPVR
jgi:prepilin-type N-terminal cleavage/methylation domain-containing protein